MASKALLVFGVLCAILLLVSLQMATARELTEKTEHQNMKEAGAEDQKYPEDRGFGGYPGRGGGYYGGYPSRGGSYGGYPGRGGGGYCRWGCCRRGYYGGCRCCSFPGEVPDAEYQAEPGN
ncbi:hypothetical protein OPV22_017577 [Ensete ventricosum]|uniref:Glycine-rich protein n=1 Tax=Ensete ventricosum TaxID=4639 RepID=A0AAV8QYA5_ENSVE|nr:hypothetical protein OPV22_017577 [Ensete ventricosum]